MQSDFNPLELVLAASLPVQAVMVILLLASVASWWIIFAKRKALKRATRDADDFEERFWSGIDLAALVLPERLSKNYLASRPSTLTLLTDPAKGQEIYAAKAYLMLADLHRTGRHR